MEFIPIYFSKNLKISNKVEISLFNLTLALARYDLAKVTYGLKHEIFFKSLKKLQYRTKYGELCLKEEANTSRFFFKGWEKKL